MAGIASGSSHRSPFTARHLFPMVLSEAKGKTAARVLAKDKGWLKIEQY